MIFQTRSKQYAPFSPPLSRKNCLLSERTVLKNSPPARTSIHMPCLIAAFRGIHSSKKRSSYQSFFLIRRPLFLYFPYSVFSLLSRLLTGFLSLPICDLCFRFRLILQRSFLFHFPVVDLFVRKMFFFRVFSFAVKISTPEIFSLGFLRPALISCLSKGFLSNFFCMDLYLRFSFLSEVSHPKNIFLFPFSPFFYRRFLVSFYENGLLS